MVDLYLSVMDALDAIDDRAIYFIEGAGQQNFVTAWGDGFVTDAAIISENRLSDPRPFFDALLKKACVNRVRSHLIMHLFGKACGPPSKESGAPPHFHGSVWLKGGVLYQQAVA